MAKIVQVVNETINIQESITAKLERNKTKVSIIAIILLCGLFTITHLTDIIESNVAKLINEAFYTFLATIIGFYAIIKVIRIKIIQN